MEKKANIEIQIRNIMTEMGRLQWTKNKLLQEERDTKKRWQEEQKREKEDLLIMEEKLKYQNDLIVKEKSR